YTIPVGMTAATFTVNDPAGFAFRTTFFSGTETDLVENGGFFVTHPNYGSNLQSNTIYGLYEPNGVDIPPRIIPKSPPYGPTSPHNQIEVDTFNAWNVPPADMILCAGISCYTQASTGTLTIVRPFADGGTKLSYFNWTASGKATSITQGSGGYNIAFTGAGSGDLTTTTQTALTPNAQLNFSFTGLPDGDLIVVQAYDAGNSNVYTGSATSSFGGATVTMNIAQTRRISHLFIGIGYTGGAGTIMLNSITYGPQII
ncbi:MAG: hypothetical protein ACLQPV_06305, partial [Vulcanimicrobiaceae bacterium]